ncbi:hypothetical protein [Cryptosporangium sp. NPDC051539]|uniref:hypothetical protein n=1 Tax=Cryptosporangium sp. NPDC051539 TaxID=3363962 RepID=UPI0037B944C4
MSVVIGLLALPSLTRFWAWPWEVRLPFVLAVVALLAATTFDLLPRWFRRRTVVVAGVLAVSVLVAVLPAALRREAPPTAGRATITSPRPGWSGELTIRSSGDTAGFVATGTCTVPKGYDALIGFLADDGSGYWLASDRVLRECAGDNARHRWTAPRVDPSAGHETGAKHPATLVVAILRHDLTVGALSASDHVQVSTFPALAASVDVFVTRVERR